MSNLRRSCGIHSNNSVTTEGEPQSTISSKKTFITLQENVQVIENRHVRHNPYTNEYIAKRRKLTKKYHQLRLQNGDHKYDDVWVGDEMDTGRAKHNVRFWMQNVHGLVQGNNIHDFQFDIATLADKNVNYFTFTETCVNTNKPGYSSSIKQAFAQIVTNGHLNLANTPNFPTNTNYQPGGVASGFDGSLRGQYLRSGRDDIGRWTWEIQHGLNNNCT